MSNFFAIYYQPYYDNINECYKNIITLDKIPNGPLKFYVIRIKNNLLSPFQTYDNICNTNYNNNCIYALLNIQHNYKNLCLAKKFCNNIMTPNEIDILYNFLHNNNYAIESQITNTNLINPNLKNSNKNLINYVSYYNNQKPNIVYMR